MAKFKRVSADEAQSKMKDKRPEFLRSGNDNTVTKAAKAPPTWSDDTRSARFVMTTEQVDRYGDIVVTAGGDMTEFLRNPVGLLFHQSRQWPVARWEDVAVVRGRPNRMEGNFALLPEGGPVKEVDETAWMIANGGISACSIGFIPNWDDIELIWDDEEDYITGFKFNAWELTECSVCAIPANPGALVKSAAGDMSLAQELVEDVLDNWARSPEGLLLPRKDFEDRYKDLAGERSFIVVDKALAKATPEVEPTAEIRIPAETDEQAAKAKGLKVVFDPDHQENKDHPHVKAIAGASGTVIDSWIVPEGEKKGIHAFAVEFFSKDWNGMFRSVEASRFKIAPAEEAPAADTTTVVVEGDKITSKDGSMSIDLDAGEITISDVLKDAAVTATGIDKSSISIGIDLSAARKELGEIEEQAEGLMGRLAKFFGFNKDEPAAKVEPIVDTPLPAPSEEEIKSARERAAKILERQREKGMVGAA